MKYLLALSILTYINAFYTQNKHLEKINLLFQQENYRIVERKCNKTLKKNKAEKNYINQYKLYINLSGYMLENESDADQLISYTKEIQNLIQEEKIYTSIDLIYLEHFKRKIEDDIGKIKSNQKTEKAQQLYENYSYFFKLQKKNFSELKHNEIQVSKRENPSQELPIIDYAKTFIGTPYVYGGTSKKGFDCSGFTKEIFYEYGHTIPRTAKDQSTFVSRVKNKNIKSGDLLFFGKNDKNISHVGIAIKNNSKDELKMIHASSSNGIIISKVTSNNYWAPKFRFAGRITD
ncbi:MAG: C40 family peptidase [Bacteroidota bacterium]|nr:C40 family peptidase [Bacteroidota bacterium]